MLCCSSSFFMGVSSSWEREGTDGCAPKVLLDGKRNGTHVPSTVLDDDDLDGKGGDGDHDEEPVVEEGGEDVELAFSQLARVDLVEQLHEHEGLEDDGVHEDLGGRLLLDPGFSGVCKDLISRGVEGIALLVVDVEDLATLEHEHKEGNDLENGLSNNVSPHDWVDNGVSLISGFALEDILIGGLSGKGQSSEGIHNQVDPEHLSGRERRLSEEASTGEHDEHGDNVDGQLELKELSDIVEDAATVTDSGENRAEVIVHEGDIGSVLGYISTTDSHSEADIGAVKSRCIVGAITGDGDGTSLLDQAVNKHEFVIGLGASHDSETVGDLSELTHVLHGALNDLDLLLLALFIFIG